MNAVTLRLELLRILRDPVTLFFTVGLPVFFYLVFGASQDYSAFDAGNGNVAMAIMVAMAAYGAVTATVGLGGLAALERRQGWGRQLGLTPMRDLSFVALKTTVAVVFAAAAIGLVFAAGALTTARGDAAAWLLSALVLVIGASVFSLYGLCFALAFGSEAAMSAAGGSIVILGFLGNIFVPLSGTLLTIAKFTPLYGYAALARYPVTDGRVLAGDGADAGLVAEPLWVPLLNVTAWTLLLLVIAGLLVGRSRGRE